MKVVHCSAWYVTESFGGTEIYVAALAKELKKSGVDQVILVPRSRSDLPAETEHEGMKVMRYDAAGFGDVVAHFGPDLFHLHSWTSGAGIRELRAARKRGLPAVFTFHNFSPVCATDTLMRHGSRPCDGIIREFTCSSCYLHNRGYSRPEAALLASAAALLSLFFRVPDSSRRWKTLASMFADFSRRRGELAELAREAAALVAPAEFLREVLIRNRVPAEKIVVSRQGVTGGVPPIPAREPGPGLRVGFVGRLEYLKGADIIAEAVHRIPRSKPVTLELIGPEGGVPGTRRDPSVFLEKIRSMAAMDDRIRVRGALPFDEAQRRMASFDLLAVPSRTRETGPMAAMEAIALGVPVLGSNLGGIPETVKDGVNGRIIDSTDPADWSRALEELLEDRSPLEAWRLQCRPGRTMADVAGEMLALYRRCLASSQ